LGALEHRREERPGQAIELAERDDEADGARAPAAQRARGTVGLVAQLLRGDRDGGRHRRVDVRGPGHDACSGGARDPGGACHLVDPRSAHVPSSVEASQHIDKQVKCGVLR